MVSVGNEQLHTCGVCGFAYYTKELAQKCEDYCKTHNGCSLEITRHAPRKGR